MDHGQYSSQHAGALKHWRGLFNTAIELTKPGIIVGNLASVLGGYLLAASGHVASVTHGLATLLGTALVIGCGCVVNNCIDRDIDRRMVRTCHRPLALRTISVSTAAGYGIVLGTCGFGLLWAGSNALACGLAMVGLVIYAGVYTYWLKRRSHWATLIGSVSGAMPPVIGYCAVTGRFDLTAMLLIAVFCCWQMPHSHAITVMRREDFRAAGLPLLSLAQAHRQIQAYMLAFLASALMLGAVAQMAALYFVVMLGLGGYWLTLAASGTRLADPTGWARRIFGFSIVLVLALDLALAVLR
ncbi:protoheme IX farnesyltransferase [Pseudomonas sp. PA-7-1E]|uniref:heme o synthase n=1 Tax=Pseudomonas TaxID=286 RepID=UPI0009214BFE|nr:MULTISPECIES: heme o synthase [Pseudomonas]MBA6041677.1 protoheme IX farnesyltransferase [Pseudomonas lactis]MCF5042319.1 protoheme IX farnesyltransferase [Pseudomonas sp. PA-7-1E]MCF5132371.1 protoheme IX farnesyltransferase [Pseudomonas sp. PA-6-4F]SFY23740.1 protoheme IX farnesyltransferase [Pseudomonas sp. NFPP02]